MMKQELFCPRCGIKIGESSPEGGWLSGHNDCVGKLEDLSKIRQFGVHKDAMRKKKTKRAER